MDGERDLHIAKKTKRQTKRRTEKQTENTGIQEDEKYIEFVLRTDRKIERESDEKKNRKPDTVEARER